jgi:hypothetical protein
MMKKVLVLLLVFGLASVANATLQISVNGVQNPADSDITLEPSQEVILDIWTDADLPFFGGGPWALVVDTTEGAISGGAPV